jgi:peptidoglycan/LPS O-acetylase OafA/YrhL
MHCALFGMTSYVLGVAWSLEIEVQFYLLMPVLALVFLIRNNVLRRALLLTAMLGIVLMQPMVRNSLLSGVHWQSNVGEKIVISNVLADMVWQRHIGNYIQFFLAGILLADVYVVSWRNRPTRQFWGDVVWFIGWPVTFWMLTFDHLASRLLFPLMIFVLYAAMFRSNIARRVMSIPLIATIGGMCYSIYLLHNTGIQLAGKAIRPILGGLPFALQMLVALLMMVPMILIVCGLFYRLVERPCMHRDWPQRLWGMLFVDTDQAKGGSRS